MFESFTRCQKESPRATRVLGLFLLFSMLYGISESNLIVITDKENGKANKQIATGLQPEIATKNRAAVQPAHLPGVISFSKYSLIAVSAALLSSVKRC